MREVPRRRGVQEPGDLRRHTQLRCSSERSCQRQMDETAVSRGLVHRHRRPREARRDLAPCGRRPFDRQGIPRHRKRRMNILGISAFFHDSAAALVTDGEIVAAAQEERFSRRKHDDRNPAQAIAYCLSESGITAADLDSVVFYEKPLRKFGDLRRCR